MSDKSDTEKSISGTPKAELLSIHLENFKSFKGATTISFEGQDVHAIIGRNGTGKSNLIEAILYVFGANRKLLRIGTYDDLIYGNTDGNTTLTPDDPNYCLVKISLLWDENVLCYERRTIYRQKAQIYLFNDQEINAEQYLNSLNRFNLNLEHATFFILQGVLEQMFCTTQKKDLAHLATWLEFLSGSIEFQEICKTKTQDIEELQKELGKQSLDEKKLRRDQKNLVAAEKAFEQAEALREQLHKKEQQVILCDLFVIEEEIKASNAKLEAIVNKRGDLQQLLAEKESELQQAQDRLPRAEMAIVDLLETKIMEDQRALVMLQNKVAIKSNSLHILEEKVRGGAEEMGPHVFEEQQLQDVDAVIGNLKEQIAFTESGGDSDDEEEEERFINEQLARLGDNPDMDMDSFNSDSKKLLVQSMVYMASKAEASRLEEQNTSLLQEISRDREKLENMRQERSEAKNALSKSKKKAKNVENSVKQMNAAIEMAEIEQKQKLYRDVLQISQMIAANKQYKLLKHLKNFKLRRLSDLVTPKEAASTELMQNVFGRKCDYLVADSAETIVKCMKAVENEKDFAATFVAPDLIVRKQSPPLDPSTTNNACLLSDLLSFDESDRSIVEWACDNALVVDTLQEALDLNGRGFNVVFRDGFYLNIDKSCNSCPNVRFSNIPSAAETEDVSSVTLLHKLVLDFEQGQDLRLGKDKDEEEMAKLSIEGKRLREKLPKMDEKLQNLEKTIEAKEKQLENLALAESNETLQAAAEAYNSCLNDFKEKYPINWVPSEEFFPFSDKFEELQLRKVADELKGALENREVLLKMGKLQRQMTSCTTKRDQCFAEREQLIAEESAMKGELAAKKARFEKLSGNIAALKRNYHQLQAETFKKQKDIRDGLQKEIHLLGQVNFFEERKLELLTDSQVDLPRTVSGSVDYQSLGRRLTSKKVKDLRLAVMREIRRLHEAIAQSVSKKELERLRASKDELLAIAKRTKVLRTKLNATNLQLYQSTNQRTEKFTTFCSQLVNLTNEYIAHFLAPASATSVDFCFANPEEPFAGNIAIDVLHAQKGLLLYEKMSGGEKTLIGICLIMALLKLRPTPIFLMDEVEAAFDAHNTAQLCKVLESLKGNTCTVFITHKEEVAAVANKVWIVFKDGNEGTSKVAVVDLDQYQ